MPPRKTQRQLADEAWHRNQQMSTSDATGVSGPSEPPLTFDSIPQHCPECGASWSPAGGVACLMGDPQQYTFYAQIQCGKCGHVILVDRSDHERLHAEIIADHRSRARPPLPKTKRKTKRTKRDRGAG